LTNYNSVWFDPPAPLADVTLYGTGTTATSMIVPMLLDTGADVTLVPQRAVEALGATLAPDRLYQLQAFDGSVSFARIAQLELVFMRKRFRGQFLTIDQEWGILGRNILNKVAIVLEGPSKTWAEFKR
jgi:predicted aspartyl protease